MEKLLHDQHRHTVAEQTNTFRARVANSMRTLLCGLMACLLAMPTLANTPSNEELYKMLLETQSQLADYKKEVESLRAQLAQTELSQDAAAIASSTPAELTSQPVSGSEWVGLNSTYSYQVLDHAENTNTKQKLQLEAIRDGALASRITVGGQVTALANYQRANEDTRFGWLMRHPTSSNQIGKSVSEAVIHSSNINFTARLSDSFSAYVEMLYNPEQNFAANSTITGLPRNNVNVRRAWILWGNLDESPLYASIGKMDIPFGWNDTVSPFTNSTNWHSFAGLAYGAMVGYAEDRYHLRAMAIQGGAQFRNANTSVEDTNVPSRLNNFAVDANFDVIKDVDALWNVGLSYQYGTAYCQEYNDDPSTHVLAGPTGPLLNPVPQGVQHFNACEDNVDAIAAYSIYRSADWMFAAEWAKTLDVWPGTANPYIPEFDAEENTTFTVGGRYSADVGLTNKMDFSLEFSRFEAGESGSDWEKQDQLVLGVSYFPQPHINLFAEAIRVEGWVPLNFLSGGNPGSVVGTSWSSQSSNTDILTIGIQAAF